MTTENKPAARRGRKPMTAEEKAAKAKQSNAWEWKGCQL